VSGTATGGNGGNRACCSGDGGNGGSVSLISNGGVNDAIGGATSGTLNLTQTAIGGTGGGGEGVGGNGGKALSTLIGTNPYGSSNYNLTANATGGNGGFGALLVRLGSREATRPRRLVQ